MLCGFLSIVVREQKKTRHLHRCAWDGFGGTAGWGGETDGGDGCGLMAALSKMQVAYKCLRRAWIPIDN